MVNISLAQLNDIRLASPCPMKWDDMEGDGNVRFCRQCSLNVHNFSEMTPDEIAQVIASHTDSGNMCAGWRRRADGTMITQDCPVGWRLVQRKLRRTAHRVAAAVGLLVAGSLALATPGRSLDAGRMRTYQPFASLCEWLSPTAPPPPRLPGNFVPGRITFGVVAFPPNFNGNGETTDRGANAQNKAGC